MTGACGPGCSAARGPLGTEPKPGLAWLTRLERFPQRSQLPLHPQPPSAGGTGPGRRQAARREAWLLALCVLIAGHSSLRPTTQASGAAMKQDSSLEGTKSSPGSTG